MEKIIVKALFFIGLISLIMWGGIRINESSKFSEAGYGYFSRAYTANTISLAKENWEMGIKFLETHNLTQGNTGAFWKTPSDDLAFFYANVLEMQNYLNVPPDTLSNSSFDQKVISGSTLSKGESFTVFNRQELLNRLEKTCENAPGGMSIYPHNHAYAVWGWISLLGFIILGIWWLCREDDWDG